MRIRFTTETEVAIADIPTTAWGRLQIRHRAVQPVADASTGSFSIPPSDAVYVFPVDAVVTLPTDLTQQFLQAKVAEVFTSETGELQEGERPEITQ